MKKTTSIVVEVTTEAEERIAAAATKVGKSISKYVLEAAMSAAMQQESTSRPPRG